MEKGVLVSDPDPGPGPESWILVLHSNYYMDMVSELKWNIVLNLDLVLDFSMVQHQDQDLDKFLGPGFGHNPRLAHSPGRGPGPGVVLVLVLVLEHGPRPEPVPSPAPAPGLGPGPREPDLGPGLYLVPGVNMTFQSGLK